MEIELCGYNVLIDDVDYEKIAKLSWYLHKTELRKNLVYFRHTLSGKTISLHRYIYGLDRLNGLVVDHINGDTLDNRKINLRAVTVEQNNMNRKNRPNKTGYKGIKIARSKTEKYTARINYKKKSIYLGTFPTPEEAHAAYCEASKKYHGEFGRTE